jgi:hypothetical protein
MSERDWLERNGTLLLSLVTMVTSCFAGLLVYALKSRCKKIRLCGCTECERDVLALGPSQITVEPSR